MYPVNNPDDNVLTWEINKCATPAASLSLCGSDRSNVKQPNSLSVISSRNLTCFPLWRCAAAPNGIQRCNVTSSRSINLAPTKSMVIYCLGCLRRPILSKVDFRPIDVPAYSPRETNAAVCMLKRLLQMTLLFN